MQPIQPGSGGGRAETGQSGFVESIDDPGRQRILGADDGQPDSPLARKIQQAVVVIGGNGNVFAAGFEGGAGVAGRHEDGIRRVRLGALPRQCVFAATRANNQNIHNLNA